MCFASPTLECNYGVFRGFSLIGRQKRHGSNAGHLSVRREVALTTYCALLALKQLASNQTQI